MRRKRSCAFHAETQEEYLKVAKDNQYEENFYYNLTSKNPSDSRANSRKAGGRDGFDDDFFFECPDSRERVKNNEDFAREMQETDSDDLIDRVNTVFNSPSTYMIDLVDDGAVAEEMTDSDLFSMVQEEKYHYMLIGALNVGKHALINSQFPDANDTDSAPLKNRLDLLIRKTETPVARTTYEFWIKELFNDSYERLIELYYKKCSVFIFVYDLTSRGSFEKLEEEIAKIRAFVGAEKFVGLLIATRSDEVEKRAVEYEEGFNLKSKYGLKHFNETNMYVEKETQQLLKKLRSFSLVESPTQTS